jgi:uncharacterized delta-60 repeat protein
MTHSETEKTAKVFRLTSSGSPDTTYAVTTTPPETMNELGALAMLPDGRAFAVGWVSHSKFDIAAVRIGAAGGLDPTYAVDTSLSPTFDDVAYAAVVQPGGTLVAAGGSQAQGLPAIALVRWTQAPLPSPDGGVDADTDADVDGGDAAGLDATDAEASPNTAHLDPTFGEGGAAFAPVDNSGARSLLVSTDGSLYAIGFANGGIDDMVAVHFSASGALDDTFGDAGVAFFAGVHFAVAAILEPSGNIVVVADRLLRLSPTGASSATTAFPANINATSIARDPASGAIYVGASVGNNDCVVLRYTAALALDTTFANNGRLDWSASGNLCDVAALGVDDDRKIVVLSNIMNGVSTHAAVARYWP